LLRYSRPGMTPEIYSQAVIPGHREAMSPESITTKARW
jgi:hypothetical protein